MPRNKNGGGRGRAPAACGDVSGGHMWGAGCTGVATESYGVGRWGRFGISGPYLIKREMISGVEAESS